MIFRLCFVVVALMALGVTTVFAAKPSNPDKNVVELSNGYPSGPHFNLNIHGKKFDFKCPPDPYGASVFIPEYEPSKMEYVASNKNDVDKLTVLDACASAFSEGEVVYNGEGEIIDEGPSNTNPVRVRLPKNGYADGFWVFARALAKPNNGKKENNDPEQSNIIFTPKPELRVCDEGEFDFNGDGVIDELDDCLANEDLLALGLVTNEGVYKKTEQGLERFDSTKSKGKGKSKAVDITGLFIWTGYACPGSLDFNGDGKITLDDVQDDLTGDGFITADDLAVFLAANCEFHNNEWVFNVADLVIQDQDIYNDGIKLVQIRFYPVATTEFTPLAPDVTTIIHMEDESGDDVLDENGKPIDVTGGTVAPGTVVHDHAMVKAGTGPTPLGTVVFMRYDNGNCFDDPDDDTDNPSVEANVLLVDGVAKSSSYTTEASTSAISYLAVYSGDDDPDFYVKSSGVCEPLAVGLSVVVTTEIHEIVADMDTPLAVVDGIAQAVAPVTVHDSATVTGSGGTPPGDVTFTFYIDGACTPSFSQVDVGTIGLAEVEAGTAVADPSLEQGPLDDGFYSFKAHYNGDGTYFPADSDCQSLLVNP